MKKIVSSLVLFFTVITMTISQSCLPEGISFSNQQEIDSFTIKYPNCVEIEGNVYIKNDVRNLTPLDKIQKIKGVLYLHLTHNLEDLTGLNTLKYIGALNITNNDIIQNLEGLDNLDTIKGKIYIRDNINIINFTGAPKLKHIGRLELRRTPLHSFDGLENLHEINGGVLLYDNNYLDNFQGLENIQRINGDFEIYNNQNLIDLEGLDSIEKINGNIIIRENKSLTNINNLINLDSINGYIRINANTSLKSLSGLENIAPTTIHSNDTDHKDIEIYNNSSLLDCSVASICSVLNIDTHTSKIQNNLYGCNSEKEVYAFCSSCTDQGITFTRQTQIDSFPISHHGCKTLQGNLVIKSNDITNLDSLIQLKYINGSLEINNTALLNSLSGLDSLHYIFGNFKLSDNGNLLNLDHLGSLLFINGKIDITYNDKLTNLNGLYNIKEINGKIYLYNNKSLSDISGLSNIDYNTIRSSDDSTNDITIKNNPNLSKCSIINICSGISIGSFSTSIANNKTGCNDTNDIYDHCEGACFKNGIKFTSQKQMDDFGTNFKWCTEIIGDVEIRHNVNNLLGLSKISKIGGDFKIIFNNIDNFTGLENLKTIGNSFYNYYSVKSSTGLDKLSSIGGALIVYEQTLDDFSGFKSLDSIGGLILLLGNTKTQSLSGLENLKSINGPIILENTKLKDISAIKNIDPGTIRMTQKVKQFIINENIYPKYTDDLIIEDNKYLSECSIASICDFLDIDNHTTKIQNNGIGCNSPHEISIKCSTTCINQDIRFTSQSQIDNFPSLYIDCNSVEGNIVIDDSTNTITNLDSLIQLKSVAGNLEILNTSALNSFSGLDNLKYIAADLKISGNKNITNLNHLDSLEILSGSIIIKNNSKLKNLNSLNNLQTISGFITIENNDSLSDISGLSNIDYNTIKSTNNSTKDITIRNNPNLSKCSIINICSGISIDSLSTSVANNKTGCNDSNDIYENCKGACLKNGINFTSQKQMDDFGTNFNWCTDIVGDVIIHGHDINNLLGLSNIKSIGGDLQIDRNHNLSDLNGLNNIKSISKKLDIIVNSKLRDLSYLNKLEHIGDDFILIGNGKIEDFTGLGNLKTIGNSFLAFGGRINSKGLDKLSSIGGGLIFYDQTLDDFTGFKSLDSIGGLLVLACNTKTQSLFGLERLKSINGPIYISNTNLNDLSAIKNVNPDAIKMNKSVKQSLYNTSSWRFYSADFVIEDNKNLSECSIESICRYLNLSDRNTIISNNKEGCKNIEEVIDSCKDIFLSSLIYPQNGDTDIPTNITINWKTSPYAIGYKIFAGTESGNYSILNDYDAGDTDSLFLTNLPCNMQVFIKILPYDSLGILNNGKEESFSTEGKARVTNDSLNICFGDDVQLLAEGGSIYSWFPAKGLNNPNIPNPIASPDTTTNYTVVVGNGNNCIDSTFLTVYVNPKLNLNIIKTDESAINSKDGVAKIEVSGGTPPYQYLWSNGDTTQLLNNLSPDKYYITVTDSLNCEMIDSVIIQRFECSQIELIYTQQMVSCYGACDGFISIDSIKNSTPPFNFSWNNDITSSSIDSLCLGNYSVTIVDGNDCYIQNNFQITEPDELTVNIDISNESYNEANDGSISLNVTGGTKPYSYSWSNGQNAQTISDLSPGSYQFTITDSNDCIVSDSVTILEYSCTTLEITSQTSNISCFNACDGKIEVQNVLNAKLPLQYKWSNDSTSPVIYNLCIGDYNVTITDAKNCTVSQNYTLIQPDEITIIIDSTRDIRLDPLGYIAISTNDNGNYVFSWTGPDNFTANTDDLDSLSSFGCYTLTVADTVTNCSIDTTICLEDKTATFDLELNNINIYPNPTKGNFIIDFNNTRLKQAEITIFDMAGKKQLIIKKKSEDKILKVRSEVLNEGLYIIRIKSAKFGTSFRKILLNK